MTETDILDEILAYTEGIQKREQQQQQQQQQQHPHHPPSQSTATHTPLRPQTAHPPLSVPQPDLAACPIVSNPLAAHYLAPPFAPSPRGIQDDFSPFGILSRNAAPAPHQYHTKPELVPCYPQQRSAAANGPLTQPPAEQNPAPCPNDASDRTPQDDDDDAAAAVAAAISTCIRPNSVDTRHTSQANSAKLAASSTVDRSPTARAAAAVSTPTVATVPDSRGSSDNANASNDLTRRAGPVVHRPHITITPAPANLCDKVAPQATRASQAVQFVSHLPSDPVDATNFQVVHGPWSTGTKRTYHQTLDTERLAQPPSSPPPPSGSSAEGHIDKKFKSETTVVMPPSAKSILERRERAIKEGRRKDAKLTDAERRILRRLRNRESAERCRLRRVQQAAQLERKIESMQVENGRLMAMAEEYEKTIKRLERVIENFSGQKSL